MLPINQEKDISTPRESQFKKGNLNGCNKTNEDHSSLMLFFHRTVIKIPGFSIF